jgi:hypothetical protein
MDMRNTCSNSILGEKVARGDGQALYRGFGEIYGGTIAAPFKTRSEEEF